MAIFSETDAIYYRHDRNPSNTRTLVCNHGVRVRCPLGQAMDYAMVLKLRLLVSRVLFSFSVICMLFVVCRFFNYWKRRFFMNTIRVSNSLDSDQAWNFVGLIWVQTVCKSRLSADDTSGEGVKPTRTKMTLIAVLLFWLFRTLRS